MSAVPEKELQPSPIILGLHRVYCKITTRLWTRLQELLWLVDPPFYDHGMRPLRQWMLTFRGLQPGASITVLTKGGSTENSYRYDFNGSETGLIEIITGPDEELILDHNLEDPNTRARILQRWLLPIRSAQLPGSVESFSRAHTRNGSVIPAVLIEGRWFTLREDGLVEEKHAHISRTMADPMRSLSLPGGLISDIWSDVMVLAIPYGHQDHVILHERLEDIAET